MEWFYYDDNGDLYNPLSYSPVGVPLCPGNSRLCAIRAFRQIINGQPRPIITPALQTEIAAVLLNLTESANVLLKN